MIQTNSKEESTLTPQERARSLNGELHISSLDGQGTRIQLSFCPEFLRQHHEEITQ